MFIQSFLQCFDTVVDDTKGILPVEDNDAGTVGFPSFRLSVPSIDSASDMLLVCCLPAIDRSMPAAVCSRGAGSRYRLLGAGARARAAASVSAVIRGGST